MNALRKVLRVGLKHLQGHRGYAHLGHESPKGSVPLTVLPTGCGGRVAVLSGSRGLVARLAALGLTPGAPFEVAQNSGHGPVIVLVRETRLALGRGEAAHILSVPAEACGDIANI